MAFFPTQNSVVLPLTTLVSKLSSSSSLPIGGTRAHLKGRSVGASPGLGVSGFLHGCNPDFISCHAQCKDDRIDISTCRKRIVALIQNGHFNFIVQSLFGIFTEKCNSQYSSYVKLSNSIHSKFIASNSKHLVRYTFTICT